jgi:hypothetical protein
MSKYKLFSNFTQIKDENFFYANQNIFSLRRSFAGLHLHKACSAAVAFTYGLILIGGESPLEELIQWGFLVMSNAEMHKQAIKADVSDEL